MKKLFHRKMILTFSVVFLLLLMGLQFSFYLFVDDFYVATNKRNMMDRFHHFPNLILEFGPKEALDQLNEQTGFQGSIMDDETLNQSKFLTAISLEEIIVRKEPYFYETEDHLILISKLPSQDYFVLLKPMGLVEEARMIFQRYMLYASGIVYLIGVLTIALLSRKISKPLEAMNTHTKAIANLDFKRDLVLKGQDEFSQLAHSINTMSHHLEQVYGDLNESLEEERENERKRRLFVSHVSHELKNPLTMIQGYAEALNRNPDMEKIKRQEYDTVILQNALRMHQVLEDLLDLSAYEAGVVKLDKTYEDIKLLVEDCVERYHLEIEKKKIDFQLSLNPFKVDVDLLRMTQLLDNLLGNAIKYVDQEGRIEIVSKEDDFSYKVLIKNTGPLMSKAFVKTMWDSYRQEDSYREGYGLGLAIAKQISDLHGFTLKGYVKEDKNIFELEIRKDA